MARARLMLCQHSAVYTLTLSTCTHNNTRHSEQSKQNTTYPGNYRQQHVQYTHTNTNSQIHNNCGQILDLVLGVRII
jgi:hypothetical protein